jgi:hypothetical protein
MSVLRSVSAAPVALRELRTVANIGPVCNITLEIITPLSRMHPVRQLGWWSRWSSISSGLKVL